jgi:hypothetical protein
VNGVTYLPENNYWRGIYYKEQPLLARYLLSRATVTGEGFTIKSSRYW